MIVWFVLEWKIVFNSVWFRGSIDKSDATSVTSRSHEPKEASLPNAIQRQWSTAFAFIIMGMLIEKL